MTERQLYLTERIALIAARNTIKRHSLPDAKPAAKHWSYILPDRSRVSGWTAAVILATRQIVPVECFPAMPEM